MTMDYTRRGLLRAATLAGIGAALLPGTTLLPTANAAAKAPAHPKPVIVKGWLLNDSDR
ncbi:twin-arginine translocation signal domain-containing protein [Halomonas sp. MC140]|nr:twin-arginine translocation signal domain-containing protein [Halomonas sp. MC140]MDN7133076.1 twin-arginine translocation signal domain-containing protein [Halomonas sp. MC140]